MLKIKKDLIDNIVVTLLVILVGFFIYGAITDNSPFKMVVIDNHDPNSMHPTYLQGDIFAIQRLDPSDYKVGDVVVYQPRGSGGLIIHRIVNIEKIDGRYYFQVKGDNSETNFPIDKYGKYNSFIDQSQLLGKTIIKIPFLGHFSLAIQNNAALKALLLFMSGGIILNIIFSKEEEKEPEYIEISKDKLSKIKGNFLSFSQSKKGLVTWGFVILLLLLILPQYFAPGIFYNNEEGLSPGLVSIVVSSNREVDTQNIGITTVQTVYYQVEVVFYDSGFAGGRVVHIQTEVFQQGSSDPVSLTHWYRLGDVIGKQKVGATIIFHPDDVGNVDQSLNVKVTLWFDSGKSQFLTTQFDFKSVGGN